MTFPRRISKLRIAPSLLLASALVAAAFALGTAGRPAGARLAAVRQRPAAVPLAARGPISAALGRHASAYRVLGLRAHNPAQRLGVSFSRAGVTVASVSARVRLELVGYGRSDAPGPVGRVKPRAAANRVDYPRPGIREWYANGPLGLEQGFDVSARPPGSGPVTLELAFKSNVRARLDRSGAVFGTAPGALRYGGLLANDARGRTLRSRLELRAGTILIRVDDRGATYPLRIDPILQQAELTSSDGAAGDVFSAAAISGDTLAVGAPGHTVGAVQGQGAVYVFVRPASGWAHATQAAELTASDGAALGDSVAVSGDTIVAGAPGTWTNGHDSQGAAYVFVEPPSGWADATDTARLTASDGNAGDGLGSSVAVSGDTIVVGPGQHDIAAHIRQGEAYVYVKPPSGWTNATQNVRLGALDGAAGDFLGRSVAISGDTIAVGAPHHQVGTNADEGAAYLYSKPAAGWSDPGVPAGQSSELEPTDGAADDQFGSAVSIAENTVGVGAINHQVGLARQGAAYVFVKPIGGWPQSATQTAELTASDGATGDDFGATVASSGDTIVAGALLHQIAANPAQGAAYVFTRPTNTWQTTSQPAGLVAPDGATADLLGISVGLSGGVAVAGSIHQVGANVHQGAVYLFGVPPTITLETPGTGAVYAQGQPVAAAYSCAAPARAAITSCAGATANGASIDTTTLGPHSFTVTANDSDGITATTTATYTVVQPPTPKPPSLTALRQSAAVWRAGNSLARITRKQRFPVGTTFSFGLSEPARVTLTFTQRTAGRNVRGKCVAETAKNKRTRQCTRARPAGTLRLTAHTGANKIHFDGRLSPARRLKRGRYTVTITATDADAQQSNASTLAFTIAK